MDVKKTVVNALRVHADELQQAGITGSQWARQLANEYEAGIASSAGLADIALFLEQILASEEGDEETIEILQLEYQRLVLKTIGAR